MHFAMYLDVLAILVRMSLSEQKEKHDPVKAVRRVQDFNWTMAKLQIYTEGTLDQDEMQQAEKSRLTHYNKFRSEVVYSSKGNAFIYQSRSLKAFEASKVTVRNEYQKAIEALSDAISDRFENLPTCPVFKNIVQILDCSKWPKKIEELCCYGDASIVQLIEHFTLLLARNSYETESITAEWNILEKQALAFFRHKQ